MRHPSRYSIAGSTLRSTRCPPTHPFIPPRSFQLGSALSTWVNRKSLPRLPILRRILWSLPRQRARVEWNAEASRLLEVAHIIEMDITRRILCLSGTSSTIDSCRVRRLRRVIRLRRMARRSLAPLGAQAGASLGILRLGIEEERGL